MCGNSYRPGAQRHAHPFWDPTDVFLLWWHTHVSYLEWIAKTCIHPLCFDVDRKNNLDCTEIIISTYQSFSDGFSWLWGCNWWKSSVIRLYQYTLEGDDIVMILWLPKDYKNIYHGNIWLYYGISCDKYRFRYLRFSYTTVKKS